MKKGNMYMTLKSRKNININNYTISSYQGINEFSSMTYECHFLTPFIALANANRFNRYSIFGLNKRRAYILSKKRRNTIIKPFSKRI